MEDIQRTQILEAMAMLVAERGVADVTVAHVVARAGTSRRAFYELFPDRKSCLIATFDYGVERIAARMMPAYSAQRRWRDGIRAALAEGLRFLDDEPSIGRLLVVHSLGSVDLARRRAETQALVWNIVDRGRSEGSVGRSEPPPVVAEGVVGAVLAVIQTRLLAQDAEPPDERPTIELFGSLMSLIVLPYLGSSAAQREMMRPAPARIRSEPGPDLTGSRFEDNGLRLTYRTGRVLSAIGQYPGASNREVAERAGIVDQGQISKLLTRLERAGAITNLSEGTARGAPNAWSLTELGKRIERGVEHRLGRMPRAGG